MVLRATHQLVEVLYPGSGTLRVTHQCVEVLIPVDPSVSVIQSLNLEDTIFDLTVINDFWPIEDSLNLQEGIRLQGYEWCSDTISFEQITGGYGAISREIYDLLSLSDIARSRNFYITVADTLGLVQVIPKSVTASVTHTINLSQSFPKKYSVIDTISLLQSIIIGKYTSLPPQDLNLVDTITVGGQWIRSVTDDINISQTFTFYYIDSCTKKSYSPFIGGSETVIDTPPLILPFVQDSNKQFRLDYPALGGAVDTVLLRSPELDNIDQVSASRINRETRGGELNIFSDPIWPKVHTLKVSFIGLLTTEAKALQSFILGHLGEDILLTDWEGREWIGVVISPEEPIVQDGDNRWSASFTFEGELLDSCTPDSRLSLVHDISYAGNWSRGTSDYLNLIDAVVFDLIPAP